MPKKSNGDHAEDENSIETYRCPKTCDKDILTFPLLLDVIVNIAECRRQSFYLPQFVLQPISILLCLTALPLDLQLKLTTSPSKFFEHLHTLLQAGFLLPAPIHLFKVYDQSEPEFSHGFPNDFLFLKCYNSVRCRREDVLGPLCTGWLRHVR